MQRWGAIIGVEQVGNGGKGNDDYGIVVWLVFVVDCCILRKYWGRFVMRNKRNRVRF